MPEVVQRPPAAEALRAELDAVAGRLEHLDGRVPDVRLEVVRERVRPEDDPRRPPRARAATPNQVDEGLAARTAAAAARALSPAERRSAPDRRVPSAFAGAARARPRPTGEQPERVRRRRPQPPARSSARGTPPCTWRCRREPGSRPCSPCTRGRGRAILARPGRASRSPITSPRSSSKSRCARPRVVCISSRVTM